MDSINETDVISYFERVNALISKNMQLNWGPFLGDLFNSSSVNKILEKENKVVKLHINLVVRRSHYGT